MAMDAEPKGRRPPIAVFLPKFEIEETLAEIRICLEKGWTGAGYKTLEFESAWKAYGEHGHALFVNSATAALHLALACLKIRHDWRDGDEVISTALTFVSTNHVILHAGLTPVLADVDQYGCLDPACVRTLISLRTRAVMFVGLGGNSGQLVAIAELCSEYGLKLVLDASHMAGTKLYGSDPGLLADIACYSFQAVKNLPTGDSGAICAKDPEVDALARQMSWLGIDADTHARVGANGRYTWKYEVRHTGFKYNGNSVMAAMALVSLRHLDGHNAHRRQIADWYDAALAQVPGITPVPVSPGCTSSRHLYQIAARDRDKMLKALADSGVSAGVHYRSNAEYPMYAQFFGRLPRTEHFSRSLLSLPMHLNLMESDTKRVAQVICSGI